MPSGRRLSAAVVSARHAAKILGIRAGPDGHRSIGIWVVVDDGRVFVRSYTLKPRNWHRTFLENPRGHVRGFRLPARKATTTELVPRRAR